MNVTPPHIEVWVERPESNFWVHDKYVVKFKFPESYPERIPVVSLNATTSLSYRPITASVSDPLANAIVNVVGQLIVDDKGRRTLCRIEYQESELRHVPEGARNWVKALIRQATGEHEKKPAFHRLNGGSEQAVAK